MCAMLSSPSVCVDLPVSDRLVSRLRRVAGVLALGLAGCLASLLAHAFIELIGIIKITAGLEHTCALTTAGGVKCWGYNAYGQFGDNIIIQCLTLVNVSGLASGVAAIMVGVDHICAFITTGGVKCWGDNLVGSLGDNFITDSLTPVNVSGLASGVAVIMAGSNYTCAFTTGGGVKCWGWNIHGQLGDNSINDCLTPVNVFGLASGVVAITAGDRYICALITAGGVKCWGDNYYGQLGDNSITQCLTLVNVSGFVSGVVAITVGGFYTCALITAGGVKCWGNNFSGQLGDNTTIQRLMPVNVSGLVSAVVAIMAGYCYICALVTADRVKCWGDNFVGQLGDGTVGIWLFPVPVLIFYSTGTPSGGNSSLSLLANFNIAFVDIGYIGNFYIAVLFSIGELFLLTPSGFIQYNPAIGGPISAYSTDTLSNRSIAILSGVNVMPFVGTIFIAGYGLNDADLIGNSKYNAIYIVQ